VQVAIPYREALKNAEKYNEELADVQFERRQVCAGGGLD
jgi:hypothetical protein